MNGSSVRGGRLSTARHTLVTVQNGTGKVCAVGNSFTGTGSFCDQPDHPSYSAGRSASLNRVTSSTRRKAAVELVFSDDPIQNDDHPLANLNPAERDQQRVQKLAEILAEAAARRAQRLCSNGKEVV